MRPIDQQVILVTGATSGLGQAPFDPADPQLERRYDGWQAYLQSKLAQVMLTRDLAGELDPAAVTINALHRRR